MLIALLFILSYDSLPPLPDLSQVVFPEPPLWTQRPGDRLTLRGYAGDFYGGSLWLDLSNFHLDAQYEHRLDWDSVHTGDFSLSHVFLLSHLMLRPACSGLYVNRNTKHALLAPQLELSSTLPWAILFGNLQADLWWIDSVFSSEGLFDLEMIFDKTDYLPHFDFSLFHTDDRLRPALTTKAHVRHLHLSIGTPVDKDFFSPELIIQYLEPKIKIKTTFKSGTVYQSLSDYFDPDSPIQYESPVPDESLKLGAYASTQLDLYDHLIALSGSYENWNAHIVPAEDFVLRHMNDVQTVDLNFVLKDSFVISTVGLQNSFHICYTWADSVVPLLGDYVISDTFNISFSPVEFGCDVHYASERNGITGNILPSVLVLDSQIGIAYKSVGLFLAVLNLTDEKKQLYDGHFLHGRQYAGGIEFSLKF